jgi:hypothetical protein
LLARVETTPGRRPDLATSSDDGKKSKAQVLKSAGLAQHDLRLSGSTDRLRESGGERGGTGEGAKAASAADETC